MRNHDAQSLYALGANKKCYVAAKKMQDSVNVKARLKKRGTYIWNLGWLVRMSKLWSCLGSYTPGRGCWGAKVGFPRVRSSFFCRHPEMVWVPEVWRRSRFCTWHHRRWWWWSRWWWARGLEIISGTRVIVSRLDGSDQLAKLAKRRLRHFLWRFFEFCEPGKRRRGSRRWLWCCWWGSCQRCCCWCWMGERSLRRRWRWRWWCGCRSWWRCRWWSPLDRSGVFQPMLSTRPGCPLGSSTWNEGEVSCKFSSWEWGSGVPFCGPTLSGDVSLGVFLPFLRFRGRGNVGMGQWERGPSGAGGTNYEESGAQTRPVKYVLRVLRA